MWLRPRTELFPSDPRWWEFNDDHSLARGEPGFGLINLLMSPWPPVGLCVRANFLASGYLFYFCCCVPRSWARWKSRASLHAGMLSRSYSSWVDLHLARLPPACINFQNWKRPCDMAYSNVSGNLQVPQIELEISWPRSCTIAPHQVPRVSNVSIVPGQIKKLKSNAPAGEGVSMRSGARVVTLSFLSVLALGSLLVAQSAMSSLRGTVNRPQGQRCCRAPPSRSTTRQPDIRAPRNGR